MLPLTVLVSVCLGLRVAAAVGLSISWPDSVRFALASTLLATGAGHFLAPEKLLPLLPPFIPGRLLAVYLSGALELLVAGLLVSPRIADYARPLGYFLVVLLLLLFPLNAYAAWRGVGPGGEWGLSYLWFRAPVQLLLVVATWVATLSLPAERGFIGQAQQTRHAQ